MRLFRKLQSGNSWLAYLTVAMLGEFVLQFAGIFLDPRLITGIPAWAKPAKFSISIAIYSATLALVLTQVQTWPRLTKALGNITALALWAEILVIDLQAWRGTTSHFNNTTPLNAALFAVMGASIAILWLASVGLTAATFKQKFSNRALGWSLRLGLLITVLGSISGALMVQQRPGLPPNIGGSHTIGAPDGGKGLPILGWSTQAGDLRVGHFVGLHAVQAIPLLYWLLSRRRRARPEAIFAGSASYLAAFVLLEWQALRGQSFFQPDEQSLQLWGIWLAATVGALVITTTSSRRKMVTELQSVPQ